MGFLDVGFSSHTAPTYYPMSKYFRQRAKVHVLMPKDVHGRESTYKAAPEDFGVAGFRF